MPLGRLRPAPETDRNQLGAQLLQEWQDPGTVPDGPVIIVNRLDQPPHTIRLFVIWDAWAQLDVEERSALIMAAYRQIAPEDHLVRVSIAWGLTNDEAAARGVTYEID